MTGEAECLVCGVELVRDAAVILNHMMDHDVAEMMAFLAVHMPRTAELLDVRDVADLNAVKLIKTMFEELEQKQ